MLSRSSKHHEGEGEHSSEAVSRSGQDAGDVDHSGFPLCAGDEEERKSGSPERERGSLAECEHRAVSHGLLHYIESNEAKRGEN